MRLGLVSFFADVSSEMLYPITPIFLTTILGASMASVGLIEGFAEGMSGLLKIYSGLWSDKMAKRRPFIWGGYFCAAMAKPLIGMASSWPGVLGARAIDRVGKGLRTAPRDAMLADAVDVKLRGAAFGWHRGMDTLGAAIGPLVAVAYLSQGNPNLRSIYFWALIPGILSVLVALGLKEGATHKKAHSVQDGKAKVFKWNWHDMSPEYKRYLVGWCLFSLTNSSDAFLLLKAKSCGHSLVEVVCMYSFYNLIYSLGSPSLGILSDRIGRKKILISGLLIFALVYLGFALTSSSLALWTLFGIYGLYMAATDGVGKALVVDLVPASLKGTGLGIFGTATAFATIIASTVTGEIWDHGSMSMAFLYGCSGALVAAIFLSMTLKKVHTS